MIKNQYIDGEYTVIEYENGGIERFITPTPTQPLPQAQEMPIQDQIKEIRNTLDLLLLKQEGLI